MREDWAGQATTRLAPTPHLPLWIPAFAGIQRGGDKRAGSPLPFLRQQKGDAASEARRRGFMPTPNNQNTASFRRGQEEDRRKAEQQLFDLVKN